MKFTKMKSLKLLLFILIATALQQVIAQSASGEGSVGIGTTTPDNSALLDLTSDTKGFLAPRMSLSQRGNIQNPANGLLVYQTDFFSGFYYYDGKKWKQILYKGGETAQTGSESSWNVNGNAGLSTSTNFIGTTDTVSVVFKVNNFRAGLLDYRSGNTSFGYRAATNNAGFNNVALGAFALPGNNVGSNNISIGSQSLNNNASGDNNVGVGVNTLYGNSAGSRNVAIGSYAGFRTSGSGSIFLGQQAGYNELGDNKLYIDNSNTPTPLIYGDFSTDKLGINTNSPNSTLSIDSKVVSDAGLEFKQLNSNSPAVANRSMKVLSLNENGKVILVRDSVGTASIDGGGGVANNTPSYWNTTSTGIQNINKGDVSISSLQLKNLNSSSSTSPSNQKVLSVDANGKLILVKDSVGVANQGGGTFTGNQAWVTDGDNIKNAAIQGNIVANNFMYSTKGMSVWSLLYVDGKEAGYKGYSGLQLASLWSGAPVFKSNGKVLTVDNAGNVILARDSVGTGSGGGISYWNNNGGRLETTTGGKVVIGSGITNFPEGYNLYVKGGILSERVRVALANSDKWADYVFKKDYQLMPLSKVEKFIHENKHLPNVPSAEEMVKSGLDLAENNAKLMEKIEELTLYLIEANKKIDKLEKKVNKIMNVKY
jgi:trimeric autotransporter adhesin